MVFRLSWLWCLVWAELWSESEGGAQIDYMVVLIDWSEGGAQAQSELAEGGAQSELKVVLGELKVVI